MPIEIRATDCMDDIDINRSYANERTRRWEDGKCKWIEVGIVLYVKGDTMQHLINGAVFVWDLPWWLRSYRLQEPHLHEAQRNMRYEHKSTLWCNIPTTDGYYYMQLTGVNAIPFSLA